MHGNNNNRVEKSSRVDLRIMFSEKSWNYLIQAVLVFGISCGSFHYLPDQENSERLDSENQPVCITLEK